MFAGFIPFSTRWKTGNARDASGAASNAGQETSGGAGGGGGGGGDRGGNNSERRLAGADKSSPPFTRDFRSLSGSSLGGESLTSFGGFGGGRGSVLASNAKRSFFPEDALASQSPSSVGTARGDAASSVISSPVSSRANSNFSRSVGSSRRGGLVVRSKRQIIDHYGNGDEREERADSFEEKNQPPPWA